MPEKVSDSLMEKIVALSRNRGFVFPGSEIYGGLQNSWDYGPLGVALMRNIRESWWKFFVESRPDVVGLESTVIMNPRIWEASGHLENFTDPLVEDKVTHVRYRADHLLEDAGINAGEMTLKEMAEAIKEKGLKSPEGNELTEPRQFNLMFKTYIGPTEEKTAAAYLRPELAQGMFVDFLEILRVTRKRLPFGIAQAGKAFRNEITAGNFIFRLKEFNLMEFEYFVKPKEWEKYFELWLGEMKKWMSSLGLKEENLHFREVAEGERAHYSKRTVDIEYNFPFGVKEIQAIAYRSDFDLKNHAEKSGADMSYVDPKTGEKFIPHVIEPTFGLDRAMLATICAAYSEESVKTASGGEESRTVLRFPKNIAPFKAAVLPLSAKEDLTSIAQEIWKDLRQSFATDYDETQSIGRRYRRQDEIGTPYCVTIDFETLNDKAVTVRDRDSMKQDRIKISELGEYLKAKLASDVSNV
ncbi:MAG: glycine--tRNA ligase [Patescibacteria group bacterium]|nr:glycine--tRNA ligase [Patescibacteria group bacterium]